MIFCLNIYLPGRTNDTGCWKSRLENWKQVGNSSNPTLLLSPSLSPDLGFVDYPDISDSFKTSCDKKHLVCNPSIKSEGGVARFPNEGGRPRYLQPLGKYSAEAQPPKEAVKLNKKLTVEIEKLPKVLSRTVVRSESKNMFLASAPQRRSVHKNRFDSRTKQISVSQKELLNSFRIEKPPSVASNNSETNFTSFSTRSFYKSEKKNLRDKSDIKVTKTDLNNEIKELIISSSSNVIRSGLNPAQESLNRLLSKSLPSSPFSSPSSSFPSSPSSSQSAASSNGGSDFSRPFRFPTLAGNSSSIPCKWSGCGQGFNSHGKLSDHIKVINDNYNLS